MVTQQSFFLRQANMASIVENFLVIILGKKDIDYIAVGFIKQAKWVFKSCGLDKKKVYLVSASKCSSHLGLFPSFCAVGKCSNFLAFVRSRSRQITRIDIFYGICTSTFYSRPCICAISWGGLVVRVLWSNWSAQFHVSFFYFLI